MVPLKYHWRSLRRRWAGALLAAAGIACATFALCLALAVAEGLESTYGATGHRDNLLILRTGASRESQSELDRATIDRIRLREEVVRASPELVLTVHRQRRGGGTGFLVLRGVTPEAFRVRDDVWSDRALRPRTTDALVGRRLFDRFANLEIGGVLRIKGVDFRIAGSLEAEGQLHESEVWVDLKILEEEFHRGPSSLLVRAREPASLRRRLEEDARLGVQVQSERAYYGSKISTARAIRAVGIFLSALLSIGALAGILNTMYAAVASRIRELALLRVLGFSPAAIQAGIVLESVLLAALGGGVGAGSLFLAHGTSLGMTNWSLMAEVVFPVTATFEVFLAGVILSILTGAAGGLFPARAAIRSVPARVLREP